MRTRFSKPKELEKASAPTVRSPARPSYRTDRYIEGTGRRWQTDHPYKYLYQNQGYKLAHASIHPVYDLLDHVKGLILQIQSCRSYMKQRNNRIPKRSLSYGPVLIV